MWLKKHYKTIIRTTYIIPILFAAGVSIAHVVSWYGITNPWSWAVYLSVGVEIAALSALAGITAKMNKWIYLPFLIVTFIQFIGNVFFSFQYIDETSEMFKDWVSLVNPLFESINLVVDGDVMRHKILLATLSGGLIPVISLSFLHLLVSFNDKQEETDKDIDDDKPKSPKKKIKYELPEDVFIPPTTHDNVEFPEPIDAPDINDIENDESSDQPQTVETAEVKNEPITSPITEPISNPESSTGKVQRDDIREIKAMKSNNYISRVGSNKHVMSDDNGRLIYKRP